MIGLSGLAEGDMRNIFVFVYQRAGTKLLTDLIEKRTPEDWEHAKVLRSQGELREPIGHLRSREEVLIEHVTGPNLLEVVHKDVLTNKDKGGTRVWYTYIWNWWGEVTESGEVPGPYQGECLWRWGFSELRNLLGEWEFFVQVRDPRNHIESVRAAPGEQVNKHQQTNPDDYFRTLCLGQRNRSRVVLDCQKYMENYHVIRFESLVSDPVDYVCGLISSIGLTPDRASIADAYKINQEERHGDLHSSFKLASSCNDRWLTWTDKQKSVFKQVLGRELIELGYEGDLLW
jgi:hypothetical protein